MEEAEYIDSQIRLCGIPGLIDVLENLYSKRKFGNGSTLSVYMSNKDILMPYAQFFKFSLKPSDYICIQPYFKSEPMAGSSYFMKTRLNTITGKVEWMTAKHPMEKLEITHEDECNSQLQWPASSIIGALGLMYSETAIFREWNEMWKIGHDQSFIKGDDFDSKIVNIIVTTNDERLFNHPVIKFFELLGMPLVFKIQKQK